MGGAVLAMGQWRGRRPRARRAAPRGKDLGMVVCSFLHKTCAKARPNDRHENAQIHRPIALTLCTYMLQYSV
jgi:hypothetical protein